MIRTLLTLFCSLLIACDATAQKKDNLAPRFLSDSELPDGVLFVPSPPTMDSTAFLTDYSYYLWGKSQRSTAAGLLAAKDELARLSDTFSPVVGFTISPENCPEIFKLVEGARKDANKANKHIKNHYQRRRPFAQFHEPSLVSKIDSVEATTYSFPSGHSVRGYIYAMILSAIVPDSTEAIMSRAYKYAMGRIICGMHYKSDIEASLLLASAVFSKLVAKDAFLAQLQRAKQEYKRMKNQTEK